MEPQLGKNLAGKDVMNSSGSRIGTLFNVTVDLRTGDLKRLLVTPEQDVPTFERPEFPTDTHGRYEIPVEEVQSVNDYIIID